MTKRLPLGTRAACAEDYARKRYGQSGLAIASIRHDGTWPCIQRMVMFVRKDSVTSGAERQKRRLMPIRPPLDNGAFFEYE